MAIPKILGISGSLREASFNTQLIKAAIASYGTADVEIADLNLPLYDGDLEAKGIPEMVTKLGAQIAAADVLIVASPEYNKGISGVLKNVLDWVSRVPGTVFTAKSTLLIGAAADRTGGETAYFMTRNCLSQLGAVVLVTPAVLFAGVHNEFNEDGTLKSEQYQKHLVSAVISLRNVIAQR